MAAGDPVQRLEPSAGQPRELGYWAALCVDPVLDILYAGRNVPLPARARRLACLHLVPLTEDEDALIEAMLTATPPDACRRAGS
jgi:hypothetical protein